MGLVRSGASEVHTKRSGVLLSVHLACALLAHFTSQVSDFRNSFFVYVSDCSKSGLAKNLDQIRFFQFVVP